MPVAESPGLPTTLLEHLIGSGVSPADPVVFSLFLVGIFRSDSRSSLRGERVRVALLGAIAGDGLAALILGVDPTHPVAIVVALFGLVIAWNYGTSTGTGTTMDDGLLDSDRSIEQDGSTARNGGVGDRDERQIDRASGAESVETPWWVRHGYDEEPAELPEHVVSSLQDVLPETSPEIDEYVSATVSDVPLPNEFPDSDEGCRLRMFEPYHRALLLYVTGDLFAFDRRESEQD